MQAPRDFADIKFFKTEDEAKAYKEDQEKQTGKLYSDVGHLGDWYWCGYAEVGELLAKSIKAAGEYYNLNVPLSGGFQLGKSWRDCH